jgi:hypothetical protein
MTVIISTVLLMTYRKGKKSLLFCSVNGAAFFFAAAFGCCLGQKITATGGLRYSSRRSAPTLALKLDRLLSRHKQKRSEVHQNMGSLEWLFGFTIFQAGNDAVCCDGRLMFRKEARVRFLKGKYENS